MIIQDFAPERKNTVPEWEIYEGTSHRPDPQFHRSTRERHFKPVKPTATCRLAVEMLQMFALAARVKQPYPGWDFTILEKDFRSHSSMA